jgi:cell division septation protein DedD
VAVALVIYFTNPGIVDGLGRSYASFVPTVKFSKVERNAPVKTAENKTFPKFRVIPEKTVETPVVSPEPEPEPEQLPEAKASSVHVLKKYQIVVGAFSSEANANKYVHELQNRDFDAAVVGNSRSGLIRVGINGSDSKSESIIILDQVRAEENPSAWLLRIR